MPADCQGEVYHRYVLGVYAFLERLRLKGLNPSFRYRVNGGETLYAGDTLLQAGYPLPMLMGDYQSLRLYLEAVQA